MKKETARKCVRNIHKVDLYHQQCVKKQQSSLHAKEDNVGCSDEEMSAEVSMLTS